MLPQQSRNILLHENPNIMVKTLGQCMNVLGEQLPQYDDASYIFNVEDTSFIVCG